MGVNNIQGSSDLIQVAVQGTFRITSMAIETSGFTLHFPAAAGNTYSVQYRDALDAGHPWLNLTNLPGQPASGDYAVTDYAPSASSRYCRVAAPAQ
jgi:hypothetical protein